jgi:hypothetical protein
MGIRGVKMAAESKSWGTREWNWGYASGGAHDAAAVLRARLSKGGAREEVRWPPPPLLLLTPRTPGFPGWIDQRNTVKMLIFSWFHALASLTILPHFALPQWLGEMVAGESIPWEEVKLCLALKWQRAARERRDGGPGGYADVLDTLVAGK